MMLVALAVIFSVLASAFGITAGLTFYFSLPTAVWITCMMVSIGSFLIGGSLTVLAILAIIQFKNKVPISSKEKVFIPNEILVKIFLYCSDNIIIKKVPLISKRFYELINQDAFGKMLLERDFPNKIKKIKSEYFFHYKKFYKDKNYFQNAFYFLKETEVKVTFWGKRIIQKKSGNSSKPLCKFALKILKKAIEKGQEEKFSLKERVIGMEIVRILKNYYKGSEKKISKNCFFTRILCCIREGLLFFPYTILFYINVMKEIFQSYSEEEFEKISKDSPIIGISNYKSILDPLPAVFIDKDDLINLFLEKNGVKIKESDKRKYIFDFKNLK